MKRLFNKLKTIIILLLIMSTLDLSKYTFMNAFENDDILKLIISGLNQIHNAQKPEGGWEKYNLTENIIQEYKKANSSDRTNPIVNDYINLSNIAYVTNIGISSTLKYVNDKRFINTSGHFDNRHTVQSMIAHYNSLSNDDKLNLSKDILNKKKNPNDVLPKFLKRLIQALNYIYPTQMVNGKLEKSTKIMVRDVSGLLVLVKNTINLIKNYDN